MTNDRITKRAVDAHKCEPDKDRRILGMTQSRGFGLPPFQRGRKVYIAQFRKDGGPGA